jgi:hypothetical protein
VRFISEELRDVDFYEGGTKLTKLATLKELFSTHLIVFWAIIRQYDQLKPDYDKINAVI